MTCLRKNGGSFFRGWARSPFWAHWSGEVGGSAHAQGPRGPWADKRRKNAPFCRPNQGTDQKGFGRRQRPFIQNCIKGSGSWRGLDPFRGSILDLGDSQGEPIFRGFGGTSGSLKGSRTCKAGRLVRQVLPSTPCPLTGRGPRKWAKAHFLARRQKWSICRHFGSFLGKMAGKWPIKFLASFGHFWPGWDLVGTLWSFLSTLARFGQNDQKWPFWSNWSKWVILVIFDHFGLGVLLLRGFWSKWRFWSFLVRSLFGSKSAKMGDFGRLGDPSLGSNY